MKAIVYTQYGSPDVLRFQDVEKPTTNEFELLVRVHAVSLNPTEAHAFSGNPVPRVLGRNGLLHPRHTMLGADFAGTVEAIGSKVSQFRPGDEVFGRRSPNGFAEYLCVSENPIAIKPADLSFEQAAAVPVAGLTALQSLRDAGQLKPGQRVLINGAAGGVGTFAVQIAKALGADVTGVTSTPNLDLVRSLGADHIIDYSREDFTTSGQRYDLIIEIAGNHSVSDYVRALSPKGICVIVGGASMFRLLQNLVLGRLVSKMGSKKITAMLAHIKKAELVLLTEMIKAGQIKPIIDRCYPFSQVPDAYRYLESRQARGKIVVAFPQ